MALNNKRLANPQVLVNNNPIAIIPNSLTFMEGLGEQTVEPHSAGGNNVFAVYAEDVSTRIGEVKFELANTEQNIALIRDWKLRGNDNVIIINGEEFSRTFSNSVLSNNYEIGLGADTNISLEFKSDPAV